MNVNNVLKDYKEFQQLQGELNYFADAGRNYEEIYDEGFIDCQESSLQDLSDLFQFYHHQKMEKLIKYGDFENCAYDLTLREVYRRDLKNIKEKLLIPNINHIEYDEDSLCWFIDNEEIVDELYYDTYSIIHPKEIIGFVEDILIDELKLNFNNRRE